MVGAISASMCEFGCALQINMYTIIKMLFFSSSYIGTVVRRSPFSEKFKGDTRMTYWIIGVDMFVSFRSNMWCKRRQYTRMERANLSHFI